MVQQAQFIWQAAGGAGGYTVLHFSDEANPTVITLHMNAFITTLKPVLASGTTVTIGPEIRKYNTATGALESITTLGPSTPTPGTGGSSAVPNAAQGLIRFRTGLVVGRRLLQGRLYVPGMSANTQLGSGEVNSSGVSALTTAGGDLSQAGDMVVWHRPTNGAGGAASTVTGASGWTEYAVQRRRRSN